MITYITGGAAGYWDDADCTNVSLHAIDSRRTAHKEPSVSEP